MTHPKLELTEEQKTEQPSKPVPNIMPKIIVEQAPETITLLKDIQAKLAVIIDVIGREKPLTHEEQQVLGLLRAKIEKDLRE